MRLKLFLLKNIRVFTLMFFILPCLVLLGHFAFSGTPLLNHRCIPATECSTGADSFSQLPSTRCGGNNLTLTCFGTCTGSGQTHWDDALCIESPENSCSLSKNDLPKHDFNLACGRVAYTGVYGGVCGCWGYHTTNPPTVVGYQVNVTVCGK